MAVTEKHIIQKFSETYGPFAFGLVSLLLIWFVIVRPELATRTIDFERQQNLVDQMSIVASTLEQTAETLGKTSVVLQMTTDNLSKVCDKIEDKSSEP